MDFSKQERLIYALIFSLTLIFSTNIFASNADDPVTHLGPPTISVVDRMGVDMTSGIMSTSVIDVMIGGDKGLSHSISSSGGKFHMDIPFYRGYQDSFFGTISGGVMTQNTAQFTDDVDILTASDGRETVRFTITGNSGNFTIRDIRSSSASGARNTLTVLSSGVIVWTKADGTKVSYAGTITSGVGTKAKMTSIEYPNGFKIHIDYGSQHQITSVSTNTGYQLKYVYENDARGITASQQNYINTTTLGEPYPHNSSWWSDDNPKYIVALNNKEQTCNVNATTCSYASHWPKATYEWPAGMPRVAYLPDPVDFVVKDAENREHRFTMRGFDIAVPSAAYSSGYWADVLPGERAVSRITHVKPPSGKTTEYIYENILETNKRSVLYLGVDGFVRNSIIKSAKRGNDELLYFFDINNAQGDMVNYRSQGRQSMQGLYFNQVSESVSYFTNWDMYVGYTGGFANQVDSINDKMQGTFHEYEHDVRGNVIEVMQKTSSNATTGLTSVAYYAGACGASTWKTCNKPNATVDPNGNTTNYTYHSASGNIASVTLPADKHGVRAKTIYSYQQYTASHNGPYSSPIWLLSQKSTCAKATTCPTSQQIITSYEYEPNNLHLVGEAVTADGQTLRTCYEYDRYGNRVTVIPPKDNLSKTTCIN